MNDKKFYWFSLAAVIVASAYPLYMGISVLVQVIQNGFISIEDYPKYIIPYTPIALSLIVGVLLIPFLQKRSGKKDLLYGSLFSVAVFFLSERIMETKILVQTQDLVPLVQTQDLVPLESWQMALCYVPPEQYKTRTWEAVDVLLGGYSPAFKIHFYLISVVIILSLLNCFYGFARMIRSGDYGRKKALIIQTVAGVAFTGMCIWACFTSFYRTGELTVSPISAVLMAVFFALLGVTTGAFVASYTLGKRKRLSTILPSMIAVLVTAIMYVGEMILLNRNLYRFGQGFLFDGLGKLVLAPADLLVIVASGIITWLICQSLNKKTAS